MPFGPFLKTARQKSYVAIETTIRITTHKAGSATNRTTTLKNRMSASKESDAKTLSNMINHRFRSFLVRRRGDMLAQPTRRSQQPAIIAPASDQLTTDRQTVFPFQQRQRHRRHAA